MKKTATNSPPSKSAYAQLVNRQVNLSEFLWAKERVKLLEDPENDAFPEESVLIHKAQQGKIESFNCLVLAYQDQLFHTCLLILGDEMLAADATQKTFLSAYRNIQQYHNGTFKTWLMRIVIHACQDALEDARYHPAISIKNKKHEKEEAKTQNDWLTDPGAPIKKTAESTEFESIIQQCLSTLPIAWRMAIVLMDVQGLTYFEAASAMQTTLGAVKSRLAHARLQMSNQLEKFCEFLPSGFRHEKNIHLRSSFLPNAKIQK